MTVNATYSSKTEALTRANSFDALLNICERVWGGRREKGGREARERRADKRNGPEKGRKMKVW